LRIPAGWSRRTPDIADHKDLRRVRYFQILMVGLGLFPADRGGDGERALLTLTSRDRSSPTALLWNLALDRADNGHEGLCCGRRRPPALGDEAIVKAEPWRLERKPYQQTFL